MHFWFGQYRHLAPCFSYVSIPQGLDASARPKSSSKVRKVVTDYAWCVSAQIDG